MGNMRKKFYEMTKKMSKRARIALGMFVSAVVLSTAPKAANKVIGNTVYLVNVDDCDNNAKLYNKKGKVIGTKIQDGLLAIVDEKDTKNKEKYEVILIKSNGKMVAGYMDGKYLEDKALDKTNFVSIDKSNISEIFAKNGTWLREKNVVDKNDDDAILLKQGTNILASNATFSSKDNSMSWEKAIHVNQDKNKLETGYIASDYTVRTDFDKMKQGRKFIVATNKDIKLKLRKKASTKGEIVAEIPNGSKIWVLPNVSSISDDNKDWIYVAYKYDGKIYYGYVAATTYNLDGSVAEHYIIEDLSNIDTISAMNRSDDYKMYQVNTESVSKTPLKLRKKPGISSEIVSYVENGSKLHTYQSIVDNCMKEEKVDGHHWIKVITNDGSVGYVASEYLDEVKTNRDSKNNNLANKTNELSMTFSNNSKETNDVDGYFTIDVDHTFSAATLETILKNGAKFDNNAKTNRWSYPIDITCKPAAVMIKFGANGYGISHEPGNPSFAKTKYYNIQKLINVCEEYQVPYGFYFFSQALNEKEAKMEVNRISEELNKLGALEYNKLPFYLDVEHYKNETRLYNYCVKNNIKTTDVVNYEMNLLREEIGSDVCLYTEHSALKYIIDFDKLDEKNKENAWVVEASPTHTTDVLKYKDNISIRQITTDVIFNEQNIDFDLMNKEFYDSLVKKHKNVKVKKKTRKN